MKKSAFAWLIVPVLMAGLLFLVDRLQPSEPADPFRAAVGEPLGTPIVEFTYLTLNTCADDVYFLSYPAKCLDGAGNLIEARRPGYLRAWPLGTPVP